MTRSLSSLALLLAIALGIAPLQLPYRLAPTAEPDQPSAVGVVFSSHLSSPATPRARWALRLVNDSLHTNTCQAVTPCPTGSVGTALLGGWISWADPDLGGDYLATRFPRGTLVRLCTPNRCIVRRSNDFGPSAKIDPPRIADLAVLDWESLCGLPRARGVCRGTVEAIGEIALPATDGAP